MLLGIRAHQRLLTHKPQGNVYSDILKGCLYSKSFGSKAEESLQKETMANMNMNFST